MVDFIEEGSINTRENAIWTYSSTRYQRILLVRLAMHMPRATGAFRKADFEIIAGWK
jgi:uncharacterized SAM-binding protein YcdF (DUF218 family)